jgi:outer membrane protein OmpA-like peptidoglycan-associated protein
MLNTALAKKRALEVQKRLIDLGVPASVMQMNKPAVSKDTLDLAEARRVEVSLLKK